MRAITRVLVPVDFSPSSQAALEYAAFISGKVGAALEVLHVWEPPGYVGPDTLALLPVGPEGGWETTRAELRREVERFVQNAAVRRLDVAIRVASGEPSDAILRLARESAIDLVVMGTHGRTGLSRLLIGSVAEAVIRRATCPVLTLRVPSKAGREGVPV